MDEEEWKEKKLISGNDWKNAKREKAVGRKQNPRTFEEKSQKNNVSLADREREYVKKEKQELREKE